MQRVIGGLLHVGRPLHAGRLPQATQSDLTRISPWW